MSRKYMISMVLTAAVILTSAGQSTDPLLFPKDNFTVETKIVKTSAGEKKVTYRSYMHIPYVANPVDKDYQSMNVSVPVRVDDKDADATNAPILFVISVGGYMSVNNARTSSGNISGWWSWWNRKYQRQIRPCPCSRICCCISRLPRTGQ